MLCKNYSSDDHPDASRTGWGVGCQRIETRGVWSSQELSQYVNILEVLVVKLASISFTKAKKRNSIHFQTLTTTADISFEYGGTKNEKIIKLCNKTWD